MNFTPNVSAPVFLLLLLDKFRPRDRLYALALMCFTLLCALCVLGFALAVVVSIVVRHLYPYGLSGGAA